MKTRFDYVSNSSSTSFIVIEKCADINDKRYHYDEPLILPNEYGCCEFGWQDARYDDFLSKLNWCAIILNEIHQAKNDTRTFEIDESDASWYTNAKRKMITFCENYDKYVNMLIGVCKKHFNLEIKLNFDEDRLFFYIDHQSGVFEKPENVKMFESEDTLYTFLASPHSYIQCGNDNY